MLFSFGGWVVLSGKMSDSVNYLIFGIKLSEMKAYLLELHSGGRSRSLVPFHMYLALLVIACVELIWLCFGRVTLIMDGLIPILISLVFITVFLYITVKKMVTDSGNPIWRFLRFALEILLFLNLGWVLMRLFNHLTMTTALPLQDMLLLGWDRALGLSWLAYFEFIHDNPWLIKLLSVCYSSLTPLSAVALFGLLIMGHYDRARFFVTSFFYGSICAMVIGLFFPAAGTATMFLEDMSIYPNFEKRPGVYFVRHMLSLRESTGEIFIHLSKMPGLVTFPSFHTAAGVILAVAFWRTRLFWPVLLYTVVMISATPLYGGHYFVDLIAGVILAGLIMWLNRRTVAPE